MDNAYMICGTLFNFWVRKVYEKDTNSSAIDSGRRHEFGPNLRIVSNPILHEFVTHYSNAVQRFRIHISTMYSPKLPAYIRTCTTSVAWCVSAAPSGGERSP